MDSAKLKFNNSDYVYILGPGDEVGMVMLNVWLLLGGKAMEVFRCLCQNL